MINDEHVGETESGKRAGYLDGMASGRARRQRCPRQRGVDKGRKAGPGQGADVTLGSGRGS